MHVHEFSQPKEVIHQTLIKIETGKPFSAWQSKIFIFSNICEIKCLLFMGFLGYSPEVVIYSS